LLVGQKVYWEEIIANDISSLIQAYVSRETIQKLGCQWTKACVNKELFFMGK
jgi:hypothetical protein